MGTGVESVADFRDLYEAEYGRIYRTVRGVVLDRSVAEDLAQDTFIRAYKARHGYRPTAPRGAWLNRIAVNLAISHLRREKLARLLPPRIFQPENESDYERSEARSVVEMAMSNLTPRLRAAVILHYYQGLTRDEVAEVLGLPPGTVASRIAKAIRIMRSAIADNDQSMTLVPGARHGVA